MEFGAVTESFAERHVGTATGPAATSAGDRAPLKVAHVIQDGHSAIVARKGRMLARDKSDRVGISIPTVTRYKAEWRKSESSTKAARKAKSEARKSAEKKTPKAAQARADVINDDIPPPLKNKEKPETPRPITPEQKKVAAQVRESVKQQETGWTKADTGL